MRKISRADIKDIAEYERMREGFRRRVIDLKSKRRLSVGPWITLVFENRDTVLFQIEEMMRVERIVQEDKIEYEIETYNSMVPEENELRATLFIEITEQEQIKPVLDQLKGLDIGETLWLEFGEERVIAQFESGHSDEEKGKLSAVHFVTFPFRPEQSRRFRSREDEAFLVLNHPATQDHLKLPAETRQALIQDLEG